MSVVFLNNPYHFIVTTFEELYPNTEVVIEFVPQETMNKMSQEVGDCPIAYGVTTFPEEVEDDKPKPPIEIYISMNLEVYDSAEVLCHELAHAVAGLEAGHNEEWDKVFKHIMEKSQNKMKEFYRNLYGEGVEIQEIESDLQSVIEEDRKGLGLYERMS